VNHQLPAISFQPSAFSYQHVEVGANVLTAHAPPTLKLRRAPVVSPQLSEDGQLLAES
jgi:hypothetical protein